MKIFSRCPLCDDPLVNQFNMHGDIIVYKNCRKRQSHIFSCMECNDHTHRLVFTLSVNPPLSVAFLMDISGIEVARIGVGKELPSEQAIISASLELPFFEPDFSDIKKLINKIKILISFS